MEIIRSTFVVLLSAMAIVYLIKFGIMENLRDGIWTLIYLVISLGLMIVGK